MGIFSSKKKKKAKAESKQNEDKPKPDPQPSGGAQKPYKLLLLGAGESGKSTFFKRIVFKYGRGWNEGDGEEYRESIYENTIESIKTLIHQSENRDDCKMDASVEDYARLVNDTEEDARIDGDLAEAIDALWNDPGIKRTFEYRASFQVPDSASYFFARVQDMAQVPYMPTEEDVLRCRDRTTGINKEELEIDELDAKFDIYDVGGQRSERRHWVKVFQDVKAVLFVVAISEFDQKCFEDDETNRLTEALKVFSMVVNSQHFEETPVILLFNKIDLFREKLESDAQFAFEDYEGPQGDYDSITNHVKGKFEEQNSTQKRIITLFISAIEEQFDFQQVFKKIVEYNG